MALLIVLLLEADLPTLAFCKVRTSAEVLLLLVQDELRTRPGGAALLPRVATYRGGYSVSERRTIEAGLFGGTLRCCIATNALELGIDVGAMAVTLHLGVPPSVASLWQQAGRAGRSRTPSVAVIVAYDAPLDQYWVTHAAELFREPVEYVLCHVFALTCLYVLTLIRIVSLEPSVRACRRVCLDANNPAIVRQHLLCAAFEHPLRCDGEPCFNHLDQVGAACTELERMGCLQRVTPTAVPGAAAFLELVPGSWRSFLSAALTRGAAGSGVSWALATATPAAEINIRNISPTVFQVHTDTGTVLDELPAVSAMFYIHPGAVYVQRGVTYVVEQLDMARRVATVVPRGVKYHTRSRDHTDVTVLSTRSQRSLTSNVSVCLGRVNCFTKVYGFTKFQHKTGRMLGLTDIELPVVQSSNDAVSVPLPHAVLEQVTAAGGDVLGGCHAANHALASLLPLLLMCEPADVGTECIYPCETRVRPPRLMLFEKHEFGVGLAVQIFDVWPQLVQHTLAHVRACACRAESVPGRAAAGASATSASAMDASATGAGGTRAARRRGCPRCVQSPLCREHNVVMDVESAILILAALAGEDI